MVAVLEGSHAFFSVKQIGNSKITESSFEFDKLLNSSTVANYRDFSNYWNTKITDVPYTMLKNTYY